MPRLDRVVVIAAGLLGVLAGPAASLADEPVTEAAIGGPLRPPDTTSPRDTLATFLTNLRGAVLRYRRAEPPALVRRDMRYAFSTFDRPLDSSELTLARDTETALYLFEVLSRLELPPADEIPGDDAVGDGRTKSWTIPDTEITIARVAEGPRAGAFLFTAGTLARAPEFFASVQHLPVTAAAADTALALDTYRGSPGPLAPRVVRQLAASLPAPLHVLLLENPVWKWLSFGLFIGGAAAGFRAANRLARRWGGRLEEGSLASKVARPAVAAALLAFTWLVELIVTDVIRFTGTVGVTMLTANDLLFYAALAWFLALILDRVGEGLIEHQNLRAGSLDTQLVRLLFRLTGIAAAMYVAVIAADDLGLPVAPLLAGLGVGGLAVALAIRPTLENVVGGFVLFADKPVRIGEFCKFGDKMGTVEAIGLRSTRLRALDRTLITVPNAEFAQLQIINFARRDRMLIQVTIGLRYETSADQLRFVLAKLRDLLIRHPRLALDPARVRFIGYGQSSLDLEIFAYVDTKDYNDYLAVREDLNLRIKDIVEGAGTGFAFPSQTLYMTRDGGIDAERTRTAEDEVARWRDELRLPFPDYPEELRYELKGKLDYPPPGSPDHRPQEA